MQNILRALGAGVELLTAGAKADTAAASGSFVDVRGYEGLILVYVMVGVVTAGSVTWTFEDATSSGGAGNAAITPIDGALTVVTTANDPLVQVARFDARRPRGWLKIIGTVVTGPVGASAMILGVKKYGAA